MPTLPRPTLNTHLDNMRRRMEVADKLADSHRQANDKMHLFWTGKAMGLQDAIDSLETLLIITPETLVSP